MSNITKNKFSKIKNALITGASSGIGLQYCHTLAKQGVNLVLVARNKVRLDAVAAELRESYAVKVVVIVQDLTVTDAAETIFKQTQAENINIDLLVNNAGYADEGGFLEVPWQAHQNIIQVMLDVVVRLCYLYMPNMLENKSGGIVNVASIAGMVGYSRGPYMQRALYRPIKSFVIGFTQQLDQVFRGKGVYFQCLCPGLTISEFHKRAGEQEAYTALPKLMWMSSETVVNKSISALLKRKKVVVVTGIFNKFAVFMWKISHLY